MTCSGPIARRHGAGARIAALGVLIGWLLLLAAPAQAHDALLGTDPPDGAVLEAPPQVMTFLYARDIPPEFVDVAVAVPGSELAPVDTVTVAGPSVTVDLAALATTAPAGTWQVVARIVSSDGHPVESVIGFTAGAGPGAQAAPAATGAASSATGRTDGTVSSTSADPTTGPTTEPTTEPTTGPTTLEPTTAPSAGPASDAGPLPTAGASSDGGGGISPVVWVSAGVVALVLAIAGPLVLRRRR